MDTRQNFNTSNNEDIFKTPLKRKMKFSSSDPINNILDSLIDKIDNPVQNKAVKKVAPKKRKSGIKKRQVKKEEKKFSNKSNKLVFAKKVKAPKKVSVQETPINSSLSLKDDFEKFHSLPDYKFLKNMKYELPESYNLHKLVLLAIDPEWIYSYWEIRQEEIEKLVEKHGKKIINIDQLYLQVFDVTNVDLSQNKPNHKLEYKVRHYKGNYFINSNKPEKNFFAVLGFKENNNHFITVLTSEIVITPRDKMSANREQMWAKLTLTAR